MKGGTARWRRIPHRKLGIPCFERHYLESREQDISTTTTFSSDVLRLWGHEALHKWVAQTQQFHTPGLESLSTIMQGLLERELHAGHAQPHPI